MFLCTFGRPRDDGALEAAWSTLCRELGGDEPDRAAAIQSLLESFPEFEIDADADRVSLDDPRSFAARTSK